MLPRAIHLAGGAPRLISGILFLALSAAPISFAATSPPTRASRQPLPSLCELLPNAAGAELKDQRAPTADEGHCEKTYGTVRLTLARTPSADPGAFFRFWSGVWGKVGVRLTPSQAWGDGAYEVIPIQSADVNFTFYRALFTRGCYTVVVMASGAAMAEARTLMTALDTRLKPLRRCDDSAPVSTGPLRLGLACDPSRLEGTGEVSCAASVSNPASGAELVFQWWVDDRLQPGVAGPELPVKGLAAGRHTIRVAVRDARSGTSGGPESVPLTRGGDATAGGSSGATPIGPASATPLSPFGTGAAPGAQPTPVSTRPPLPTGPIVAGTAIAVAAALALLALRRRGKGQPSAPPAAPLAAKVKLEPPPQQQEQQRDQLRIAVELLLEPSIRTQTLRLQGEPCVWGDFADFCYAGYRIHVLTPGWLQTDSPVVATLQGDAAAPYGDPPVQGLGDVNLYRGPQVARRWKVKATWSLEHRPMPLKLHVIAWFRNLETGGAETRAEADAAAELRVIGACPRLELHADAPANADGADCAHIQPVLWLFGLPYTGGVEVTQIDRPREFERYFYDPRREEDRVIRIDGADYRDPKAKEYCQSLIVRCRFHLVGAQAMQDILGKGAPVSFWVRPTGHGPAEDVIRGDEDVVARDHYRSCRANLPEDGLNPQEPAFVELRPSRIDFEWPDGRRMPRPPSLAAADQMFRLRLQPVVVSADGRRVPGSDIRAGRHGGSRGALQTVDGWWLEVKVDLPQTEKLRTWDPLNSPEQRKHLFYIVDVDENGHLTFQNQSNSVADPWCDYDHWKRFWNAEQRYLAGQCCTAHVDVYAGESVPAGSTSFSVGPPCKVCAYVNAGAGGLDNWTDYGHAFVGLIDTQGVEQRWGFSKKGELHLPKEVTGEDPVIGTVIATVRTPTLGALACEVLAKYVLPAAIPGVGWAATGLRIITLVAIEAESVMLGLSLGVGPGAVSREDDYGFHICRSWDVSKDEFDAASHRVECWLALSNTGDLIYDLEGVRYDSQYVGNCASMVRDVCKAAQIELPFNREFDFTRPGNICEAFKRDPRAERNESGSLATYKRHWVYAPAP